MYKERVMKNKDKQLRFKRSAVWLQLITLFVLMVVPNAIAQSQWTSNSDGSISNANPGFVGIGAPGPPDALLSLRKDGSFGTEIRVANRNTGGFSGLYLNSGFTQASGGFIQWNNTTGYNNLFVATGGANPLHLGTNNSIRMTILPTSGNVGIGTSSPRGKLDVLGLSGAPDYTTGQTGIFRVGAIAEHIEFGFVTGTRTWIQSFGAVPLFINEGGNNIILNSGGGRVGIGTPNPNPEAKLDVNGNINVTGNVTASGSIAAKYQDIAEWVPSIQKLSAGTVIVLDSSRVNHVRASTRAYDTSVAGVISESPGLILGEEGKDKLKVATTGRVKVRVNVGIGSIQVGDLLVTSGVEGVAMKSVPIKLGGVFIHRPGTLIGKALEPLEKGTGEILVLLSLQ
jgi:hypothetical protein